MYDLIIIGGGAAGLCCAGFAAKRGLSVLVAEGRERPARKILVTGKGRCNVTNNGPPEEVLKNVCGNPRFLYSAMTAFPPAKTMALFEGLGVPLKTERGGRVFPVSDSAREIADALVRFAREAGAEIIQAKANHQEITQAPAEQQVSVINMMDALQQMLEQAKAKGAPSARQRPRRRASKQ